MEGKIYSPEKAKFVSVKTKHGQKVLKIYNEHLLGGDKHHNCAYCKIVNPKTGKMVSTYGQTGGRVIKSYVEQEGGAREIYYGKKGEEKYFIHDKFIRYYRFQKIRSKKKYIVGSDPISFYKIARTKPINENDYTINKILTAKEIKNKNMGYGESEKEWLKRVYYKQTDLYFYLIYIDDIKYNNRSIYDGISGQNKIKLSKQNLDNCKIYYYYINIIPTKNILRNIFINPKNRVKYIIEPLKQFVKVIKYYSDTSQPDKALNTDYENIEQYIKIINENKQPTSSPTPSQRPSPGPGPYPGVSLSSQTPSLSPSLPTPSSPTPLQRPSPRQRPSPTPLQRPSPTPSPRQRPLPTPSPRQRPLPTPSPNLVDGLYPIIINTEPDIRSIDTYNFFNNNLLCVTQYNDHNITINEEVFRKVMCVGRGSYGEVCHYTSDTKDIVIKSLRHGRTTNYNKIASEYLKENGLQNLKKYIVPHISHEVRNKINLIIMPKILILENILKTNNNILEPIKIRLIILYNIIQSIYELFNKGLFYTDIKLDNVGIINIKDNEFKCFLIDLGSISKEEDNTLHSINHIKNPPSDPLNFKAHIISRSIDLKIINNMFTESERSNYNLYLKNRFIIHYLENLKEHIEDDAKEIYYYIESNIKYIVHNKKSPKKYIVGSKPISFYLIPLTTNIDDDDRKIKNINNKSRSNDLYHLSPNLKECYPYLIWIIDIIDIENEKSIYNSYNNSCNYKNLSKSKFDNYFIKYYYINSFFEKDIPISNHPPLKDRIKTRSQKLIDFLNNINYIDKYPIHLQESNRFIKQVVKVIQNEIINEAVNKRVNETAEYILEDVLSLYIKTFEKAQQEVQKEVQNIRNQATAIANKSIRNALKHTQSIENQKKKQKI